MQTFEEEFEEKKQIANQVPIKNRSQLQFIKNHTSKFKGNYFFLSPNYNDNIPFSGEIDFIPRKIRVMSNSGNIDIYISCDVIFSNIKTDNERVQTMFDSLKNDLSSIDSINRVSNMFNNASKEEFEKLMRLIGMTNFKLHINNIIIE
jgi:hypothetical protein